MDIIAFFARVGGTPRFPTRVGGGGIYQIAQKWSSKVFSDIFGKIVSCGDLSATKISKMALFCLKGGDFAKCLALSSPKSGSLIDFGHPFF